MNVTAPDPRGALIAAVRDALAALSIFCVQPWIMQTEVSGRRRSVPSGAPGSHIKPVPSAGGTS